jgi:hypothetical protein
VAVAAGGGIISIIMIIKLGPNIAAYEACITLSLLFSTVWCWRRFAETRSLFFGCWTGLGFIVFYLFSLGLLREIDLRYLRNELVLSSESDGANALCVRCH